MIYWTTIFGHRNGSGGYRIYTGVPGGYRNPPGGYWASWAQLVEEERRPRGSRAPLPPSPNWTRRGGGAPLSFPPLSFPLLSYSHLEGGSPTPGGSRTPHGARQGWPAPSPSSTPLYTGREAPPRDTTIDPLDLLAVCGAPSTIIHLDNIIAVLRRSTASVEHHHRHHAVMLTKLSLKARLDRSSRDVIELNVC